MQHLCLERAFHPIFDNLHHPAGHKCPIFGGCEKDARLGDLTRARLAHYAGPRCQRHTPGKGINGATQQPPRVVHNGGDNNGGTTRAHLVVPGHSVGLPQVRVRLRVPPVATAPVWTAHSMPSGPHRRARGDAPRVLERSFSRHPAPTP